MFLQCPTQTIISGYLLNEELKSSGADQDQARVLILLLINLPDLHSFIYKGTRTMVKQLKYSGVQNLRKHSLIRLATFKEPESERLLKFCTLGNFLVLPWS